MPPPAYPSGLPDIREALLSPPERADLDAVAQHFAVYAGGAQGMAKLLYDEYLHAEPGSPTRARVMEMMMRTFGKLDGRVTDDLSLMADDDLDRLLNSKLRRMGNGDSAAANPGIAPTPGDAEAKEEKPQEEAATAGTGAAPTPDASVGDPAAATSA